MMGVQWIIKVRVTMIEKWQILMINCVFSWFELIY